ncbi:MAG: type II 3-dehydroquinate dehydratase [Candidatus Riflebacteria bacterium]|nr:type II 3-dehydroquinate dehydratase [Candidatus Riflebacteria bacterium]
MKILIVNGPNLNMLGQREPGIYGTRSLADLENFLKEEAKKAGVKVSFFQSNHEGALIDRLQKASQFDGIILNAGGYTHTSIAIRDTIATLSVPVIEIHISNIYSREDFRCNSMLSAVCKGVIAGLGLEGYLIAMQYFVRNKRTAIVR